MLSSYEQTKANFLNGRFKNCKSYFKSNGYFLESGYCNIILDNLKEAREDFEKISDYERRAHWCLLLLQMIEGKISMRPTYCEIRNFLEIDLSILILYAKAQYVEKIIRYSDFLAFYNTESYKFIGRAFWANNFVPAAMFFLNIAKDKLYKDPELHYLLAYIYYTEYGDLKNCKKSLQTCLDILPQYAPAEALLKKCG